MNQLRIEARSLDALEAIIRQAPTGLIAIDGCPLAGKSTARVQLCERLGAIGLELDNFVVRDQREYVKALRTDDVSRALQDALSRTGRVLLDGVCMREILALLGFAARLHVYVQPISPYGIPSNLETLDAEDGKPLDPTVATFFNELDHEVFRYHAAYRPFKQADVIYYRTAE
ncbi:hypothetical protein WS58_16440 [Burkholderia pseudomultivorans]|uniref:hypothetical protein n=1 Tax=Burkholderia pseudomultivorans TaxID=1207504 RepID=UPI00075A669C|nr:hypothetical protein [Burkholderia pseudomultivorans]AOI94088.1 hypothetical protein WS57_34755 [Burkholderia pseudomultivorans]KVC27756.1 hypothetical protein WS55_12810 [Burkholderia pseudomultivorans]KVC36878.1 hypothetical protein WS56_00180 [Burkholderia pseudomultivorans]KVC42119.1 hypothetical protein WS58_16440 [Burkholderia pseudomultivorans]